MHVYMLYAIIICRNKPIVNSVNLNKSKSVDWRVYSWICLLMCEKQMKMMYKCKWPGYGQWLPHTYYTFVFYYLISFMHKSSSSLYYSIMYNVHLCWTRCYKRPIKLLYRQVNRKNWIFALCTYINIQLNKLL